MLVFIFSGCSKEDKAELDIKTGDANSASSEQNEIKENVENKIQNQQQFQAPSGRFGEGFEAGISACEGKTEGDSCRFSFEGVNNDGVKEINGICKKSPQSEELSCRPETKDHLTVPAAE